MVFLKKMFGKKQIFTLRMNVKKGFFDSLARNHKVNLLLNHHFSEIERISITIDSDIDIMIIKLSGLAKGLLRFFYFQSLWSINDYISTERHVCVSSR